MSDREDRTENFYKEMNGFKIRKFIIVGVDADAEKQASISPVHDFIVSELICRSASWPGRS